MFLVCHVILQDHEAKGSCDFMVGIPSWQVKPLTSFVAIGIVVHMMVLVCLVILPDHEPEGLSNFMGRSQLRLVPTLPSLVAIGTVVVEIY